jgi:hypothetical protein
LELSAGFLTHPGTYHGRHSSAKMSDIELNGYTFLIVRPSEAIAFALGCHVFHWLVAFEVDDVFVNYNKDNLNVDLKFRIECLRLILI